MTNSLRDAVILVVLILFLFLQNWKATLVPAIAIPVALIGTFALVLAFGFSLNQLTLFGLVLATGLAGSNAILIVDLANQKMGEGESALEAAKFSAKSRLRPILMTAISSLTGFLPLMLASGAGAQSQSSLGLVVFGGLLVATFLSTLVVPVFYVVMKSLLGQADTKPQAEAYTPTTQPG